MANFASLEAFGRELGKMGAELKGAGKRKITTDLARRAEEIAYRAAAQDLGGDPKFSGWRPWLKLDTKTTRTNAAVVHPTRHSAGPWTVAERGRNQGNAGGFHGPGVNSRTGLTARTKSGDVRRVRTRKAKRWNGRTTAKNTASDAISTMNRVLPLLADDGVKRVMRKHFDVT